MSAKNDKHRKCVIDTRTYTFNEALIVKYSKKVARRNTNHRPRCCKIIGSEKTIYNGGADTYKLTKIRNGRRQVRFILDAFGSVNQEVEIELVDEEPTDEMMAARERFWEKVFAELLTLEEERPVKAKRLNRTTRKS